MRTGHVIQPVRSRPRAPFSPLTGTDRGEHLGRVAFLLVLPGLPVMLVATAIWQIAVGVASMGGDEADLTRGWKGFWLSLPAYALVIGIAATAFGLALRSRRLGAANARVALVASTLGLLVALGAWTRDSAEIVMTTRSSSVSWLLFAADAVVVAIALALGVRRTRR